MLNMLNFIRPRFGEAGSQPSEVFDCADAFGYGNFQRGTLFFAILSLWVMYSNTLAIPLISSELDHWCAKPADLNLSTSAWKDTAIPLEDNGRRSRCTVYAEPSNPNNTEVVRCDHWHYDEEVAHTTIVSLWNLVCHRRWLIAVANAIYMAGALGFLVASAFATDVVGRRPIILSAASVLMVATLGGCFANTYLVYLCSRFLISGTSSTLSIVACVLVTEVSTNQHRAVHVSVAGMAGLWLGEVCFAALQQVRLNWILRQLLMVSPTLLIPLGCTLITESPRWLIARRDLKGAEAVIQEAVKRNGFSAQDASAFVQRLRALDLEHAKITLAATTGTERPAPSNVLRRASVILSASFTVMGAYYAVLLAFAARHKSWMSWTSLVAEAASFLLYLRVVDKVDRVTFATVVYLLAGTSCCFLAGTLVSDVPDVFSTTLLILAKVVSSVALVITSLCAAEQFPSIGRGLCLSLYLASGRLGGVFAGAASNLRPAGREDVMAVMAGAALYLSSRIIQWLPRGVGPFDLDVTRTTAVSARDIMEAMKISLEPRPKAKVRRKRRSTSTASHRSVASQRSLSQHNQPSGVYVD